MIYIAKCYVGNHRPGEAFDADIPDKELKRLIARGAIEPTNAAMEDVFDASGIRNAPDSDYIQDTDLSDPDADNEPDDDGEAVICDEPDAPEIDVMEGICADEEPAEAKAEKRRTRK